MQEIDIKFLEDSFKEYYFKHFDLIHVPERHLKGNLVFKNLILE